MKNIIGFEKVKVSCCKKCECIFTFEDEDIKQWTINNKQKRYVVCPNCKSNVDDFCSVSSMMCIVLPLSYPNILKD